LLGSRTVLTHGKDFAVYSSMLFSLMDMVGTTVSLLRCNGMRSGDLGNLFGVRFNEVIRIPLFFTKSIDSQLE